MLYEDETYKVVIGIVVFIAIFLIIIIFPIYMLLSPIDSLKSVFKSNETKEIKTMKQEYRVALEYGKLEYRGTYPMPIYNGKITSNYGTRIHPITKKKTKHTGIDIVGSHHCNVMTIADGKVIKVDVDKSFGNTILIKHTIHYEDENGNERTKIFYSFYAHLSRVDVIEGMEVYQGNVIGLQGGNPNSDPSPGLSTGEHLHFEIRTKSKYGSDVNPNGYILNGTE